MDVRENGPDETFGHVDHPLLRQRVRDPKSLREGELMAVVEECLGTVRGIAQYTRTAYVRGADGLEFTAAPDTLEQSCAAAAAAGRVCVRCDHVIRAGGVKFIRFSASGARPNEWAHDLRDPSCKPVRADGR
ncbi:hypothetical protein ACIBEA_19695 [Streptomyces sp. NPDC051555]|uniref:hypothetical protein n=1 Tax=Streptomyces sp. NPDC051555 TaxID=3365657 RepID=UPI0037B20787